MLPNEVAGYISRLWPCRERQARQLSYLLCNPILPSPPSIIVHGPSGSGKSTILKALLQTYANAQRSENAKGNNNNADVAHKAKRQKISTNPKSDVEIRRFCYAMVRVAECISANHLLMKIISNTIDAVQRDLNERLDDEWVEKIGNIRCEHVSALPEILSDIISKASCTQFVLLLDGIDELREGGHMLLAALSRVGEMLPNTSIVFTSKFTPRPLLLHTAGVPHITFPPYTRTEIIQILTTMPCPPIPQLPDATASKLYPPFLTTLYDSLIGPTAGTIPIFQSACEKLWPRFVAPILNGETPPGINSAEWDFPRLLVKNRSLFQYQGEQLLSHHIVAEDYTIKPPTSTLSAKQHAFTLPSLPYQPTLILTAAFLAAHTPSRLDLSLFSKFTPTVKRRRRRLKAFERTDKDLLDEPPEKEKAKKDDTRSKASKRATEINSIPGGTRGGRSSYLINPHSFSLERLIAIYRVIDPNPPLVDGIALADTIYPELATLQRLRLLVPASAVAANSGAIVDGAEKWSLNVNAMVGSGSSISDEWVVEMARGIGIEVEEYLGRGQ